RERTPKTWPARSRRRPILRVEGRAELVAVAATLAITAALAAWLGTHVARGAARRRLERARQRGAAGEARAERLLVGRGYRVVGRQVRARYGVAVDGAIVPVDVRADYVVSRGDARY